jgi:hypothetical protein
MATTQPTKTPQWATDGGRTLEPSAGEKGVGWEVDKKPPARFMNWLQNLAYLWLLWISERFTDGLLAGGGDEEDLSIRPPVPATDGGALELGGADGNGTGIGGDAVLKGGDAATTGAGGDVDVSGGDGAGVGAGGDVSIDGGDAGTSGAGGSVTVAGGTSADANGSIVGVQGGTANGTDKDGGNVSLIGGIATGAGSSDALLGAAEPGASGATVRVPTTYLRCDGSAKAITTTRRLSAAGISGDTEPAIKGDASAGDGYGVSAIADPTSPVRASLHLGPQDTEPTTKAKGDVFPHDHAGHLRVYDGDQWNRLVHQIYLAASNSSAITNTTAETVFDRNHTIPANKLASGDLLRIRVLARITGATAAPNLIMRVRIGGLTGTLVAQSTAVAVSGTQSMFLIDVTVRIDGTGASAAIQPSGMTHFQTVADSAFATAQSTGHSGTGGTVDTTIANQIVVTAQWSAASASNTVELRGFQIDQTG